MSELFDCLMNDPDDCCDVCGCLLEDEAQTIGGTELVVCLECLKDVESIEELRKRCGE